MPHLPPTQTRRPGFTLVEVLIVVALTSILAVTIVSHFVDPVKDAQAAVSLRNVRIVQAKLAEYYGKNGRYPPPIDANWFSDKKLPTNPFAPTLGNANSNIDSGAVTKRHPDGKTTESWPFWYNPNNGCFRVRVPAQSSNSKTLALYNLANGSRVRSLSSNAD